MGKSSATRALAAYGGTAALVVLASLATLAIAPWLEEAVLLLLLAAVVAASWYGGQGPGLVAAFGSAMIRHCPIIGRHPVDRLDATVVLRAVSFAMLGAFVAILAERCRRALSDERRHRQYLERAFAGTGDGIILTDESGRIRGLNHVAASLTGWSREAAEGRPLEEIFDPARPAGPEPPGPAPAAVIDGAPAHAVTTNGAAGPHVRAGRSALTRGDGVRTAIEHRALPVRDRDGFMRGLVLVFRDLTERNRAEATRARLAAIVETSEDAIVGQDLDGRISSWNPAAERLYGYPASAAIGRDYTMLVPPEERAHLARVVAMIVAGRRVEPFETRRRCREGKLVEVFVRASPIRGGDGSVIGISTIGRDITDRKRIEDQLRRASEELEERVRHRTAELARINDSLQDEIARRIGVEANLQAERARLEAVLNQMPSALVIVEAPSGRPVLYNDEVTRQLDEPLSPWRDVEEFARSGAYHADGRPYEPDEYPLARALAGETVRAHDLAYRRGDGGTIWRSVNAASIRDPEGRIIAAVCVSLDVTEGRRAEAQRAALWAQLAAVQEQERSRLARDLHDRMGQHLAALMLCLAAMEDDARDGVGSVASDRWRLLHDLTGEIGREVHRIAWELRPTALDDLGLPAAVEQYVEDWSERTRVEADIQVGGLGPARLPAPIETALYRIIQEALTNVAKHAHARRVRVVLGRRERHAYAIVEDDGRGFDPGAAARRPGPAGDGGLGLLGMRERVALAGGTLEVESAPGEGTIILTSIPLADPEDVAAHG